MYSYTNKKALLQFVIMNKINIIWIMDVLLVHDFFPLAY